MLTYTYISKGKFGLVEKPKPMIQHERDAIVKVTLASICSSDLHIKHGSVPRAVEEITVGHEMVGIVEEVGSAVTHVKPCSWATFLPRAIGRRRSPRSPRTIPFSSSVQAPRVSARSFV